MTKFNKNVIFNDILLKLLELSSEIKNKVDIYYEYVAYFDLIWVKIL